MESALKAKIILCDIEGTTTSISFVKDTLFPYARKHVEVFIKTNWNNEKVKLVLKDLEKLSKKDVENKIEGALEIIDGDEDSDEKINSIVKNVEFLMDNDRKVSPLKILQGLIWEQGYKDGSIKGHIFDDVPKSFEFWTTTGHKVIIYSSGSIAAQKLLFEYSSAGNLLKYVSGHFDIDSAGPKQLRTSYSRILEELVDVIPSDVVFLTDIIQEARAAREAGLHTIVLNRPGNKSFSDEDKLEFLIADSFADIIFEPLNANKRKFDEEKNEQEPPQKVVKTDTIATNSDKKIEPIKIVSDEKTENIETKTKIEEKTEKTEKIEETKETKETTVLTAETTEQPIATKINEEVKPIEIINETKASSEKTEIEETKDCPITETEKMETDSTLDEKIIPAAKILNDEKMEVEEEKETEKEKEEEIKLTETTELNIIKSDLKESEQKDESTEVNGEKEILCQTELKETEKETEVEKIEIEGDLEKKVTDEIIETNKTEIVKEPTVISEINETDLNKIKDLEENKNEIKINEIPEKLKENNISEQTEITNGEEVVKKEEEEEKTIKIDEQNLPLEKQEESSEIVEKTEIKLIEKEKEEEKTVLTEKEEDKPILTEKTEETVTIEKVVEENVSTSPVENLEKTDEEILIIKTKTEIKIDEKNGDDESSKKNGDSDKENDIENKTEITKIDGKETVSSEIVTKKCIDDVIMTSVQAET